MAVLKRRWFLWTSLLLAARCFGQTAPNPDISSGFLNDFFHTAWTEESGAPAYIGSFAQTTDGYLWMSTVDGLYRFDGDHFERYESQAGASPKLDIYCLVADSDGALWIGSRTEGISILKNNNLKNFGAREGLPPGTILQIALDRQGEAWAASFHGLFHLRNGHWDAVGSESGYSANLANEVIVDRRGTVWAAANDTVFHLYRGDRQFHSYKAPWRAHLVELVDGSVWISPFDRWAMPAHVPFLAPGQIPNAASLAPGRGTINGTEATMFGASDGSIWSASQGDGLARFRDIKWLSNKDTSAQDAPQRFAHADGLTGDTISAMFEDREGDIWVSTSGGLDRFRKANIHRIPLAVRGQRLAFSIAADSHDGVWSLTRGVAEPLAHLNGEVIDRSSPEINGLCLYRDPTAGFWVCQRGQITRIVDNRAVAIPFPNKISPAEAWWARAITVDATGDALVSIQGHGVYRLHNGSWQIDDLVDSHGVSYGTAFILWTDALQRVWSGYIGNRVVLIDGMRVRAFSSTDGLAIGNAMAFGGRRGQVWVGGANGLAILQGDRFQMVLNSDNDKIAQITGIVETENGDLWLNQASGLAHISAAEIGLKLKDPAHVVRYELYDHKDGLPGTAIRLLQLPSAAISKDGRIWITGSQGLGWIDPAHIDKNLLPPPVTIQKIIVSGHAYDPSGQIDLRPGTTNIQIDYAALSLSIPERVHFRYRLEGIDKNWQEVVGRRTAFYTNLGPGHYRFRVVASNNDGVWNLTGAEAHFSVAPFFYQSLWFRVLCVLALAGILFLLYLLRLGQVTAHMQETLSARVAERERIARDLHDTLLQSVQGLILRFRAVVRDVQNEQVGRKLEPVLDRADEVLVEGRERVRNLRSEDATANELSSRLAEFGDGLAHGTTTIFRLLVVGMAQPLNPIVRDEIYTIGREALTNAFQHAKAGRIEADLTYSDVRLTLRIRDDGVGIGPEIVSGGRTGHWGLQGMRERARTVGGKISIWSSSGVGTEIELTLPAKLAYLGRPGTELSWIRRALRGWR